MERVIFETELHQQGYAELVDRRMEADALNPEHAHEFDARLLVLEGTMTITAEGIERTYRAGETFTMGAGCAIPSAADPGAHATLPGGIPAGLDAFRAAHEVLVSEGALEPKPER